MEDVTTTLLSNKMQKKSIKAECWWACSTGRTIEKGVECKNRARSKLKGKSGRRTITAKRKGALKRIATNSK